jgi:aryl-alcohol dehydrogenase-like predicted oxidoreductase
METRPFGKTGKRFPILSLGCQRIVDAHDCDQKQAVAILNTALDRGIRYFDTAWVYSQGQSEQRVGLVAKDRREEMWIATKVRDRTRDGGRKQLEESLKRLQTDHIDEWRIHNVMSFDELDACFARGGVLEALVEAREQGTVRNLSISGHTDPQIQIEALRRFEFDSVLVAVSALDHFIYSFAEEFLPFANSRGVATIGMKVFALGKLGQMDREVLRYTLGLPVSTVIVGCSQMEELERDLEVAENFEPFKGPERLELFRRLLPMVKPQNMPWKAAEWGNPVAWADRVEPRPRFE